MALIRWGEQFREVESLQRQMNRLFDSLVPTEDGGSTGFTEFVPAAEMHETPEAVHLRLEVPGIEAKDLNIEVQAEAVSISGDRKSETKTEEKGMTRSEFRYGSFRRVIPLPARIKNEQVQAEYKNGVVNLTLPKAEEEKNRVFKVNLA